MTGSPLEGRGLLLTCNLAWVVGCRLAPPAGGVRACTHEPNARRFPSFCPMPVESEELAAVERRYLEAYCRVNTCVTFVGLSCPGSRIVDSHVSVLPPFETVILPGESGVPGLFNTSS